MGPPRTLTRLDDLRSADVFGVDTAETEAQWGLGRYFEADCPAGVLAGDVVYMSADKVGGVFQVDKVDITDETKMPAVGIVQEKESATRCRVMVKGLFISSGLTRGKKYAVSTSGTLTATNPTPPGSGYAIIQVMGVAISDTELLLNPSFQTWRLVDG
jgi:hypothetical protein